MTKKRPLLPNLVTKETTEIESFQNLVIRPIIKMQHGFLLAIFNNYVQKKKIDMLSISKENRNEKISSILQKDQLLKKMILGSIIGNFSQNELFVYFSNENDFNKRIIGITTKRLQDSL